MRLTWISIERWICLRVRLLRWIGLNRRIFTVGRVTLRWNLRGICGRSVLLGLRVTCVSSLITSLWHLCILSLIVLHSIVCASGSVWTCIWVQSTIYRRSSILRLTWICLRVCLLRWIGDNRRICNVGRITRRYKKRRICCGSVFLILNVTCVISLVKILT